MFQHTKVTSENLNRNILTFDLTCAVICQLESSGKWPDDVEAIEKIKTSFYLYISKALREQCSVISSPTIDYLDVLKARQY